MMNRSFWQWCLGFATSVPSCGFPLCRSLAFETASSLFWEMGFDTKGLTTLVFHLHLYLVHLCSHDVSHYTGYREVSILIRFWTLLNRTRPSPPFDVLLAAEKVTLVLAGRTDWLGGVDETGIWHGPMFSSSFIRTR
ncbi:hypothetical protein BJ170DRAFT_605894 [Xylariales sp. AK1849]|nr:hypothetical protein BJ170DRAFT_605894 [Xylariales sp. AK1849]